jgi:site-specific DNA-cytosine methylase
MRAFRDIPVFKRMEDLCNHSALDWRSGEFVPVQQVKGLWDGYPCTSISSCRSGKAASFSDDASATGSGFRALLKYIDSINSLQWIICENVRNMYFTRSVNGTDEIPPASTQNEALTKRGFVNCSVLTQSKYFGLPQSRTRCWILYVKLNCMKNIHCPMDRTFKQFECQSLPLTSALSGGNVVPTCRRPRKGGNWQNTYKEFCNKLGESKVHANLEKLGKFATLQKGASPRELKVLAVALTDMEARQYKPWDDVLVVQLDQDFGRNWCRTDPHHCPCVVPKGKYVLTHLWKFLGGQDSE